MQFRKTYWVWFHWLVDRDFTNDLTLPLHYKVMEALLVNSLNWPLLTCEKSHELAHAVSMKPRRHESGNVLKPSQLLPDDFLNCPSLPSPPSIAGNPSETR